MKKTKRTKFFRVAVSGMALNGLEITNDMINKMAANYNPEKYSAIINVEHVRGFSLNNDNFPTLGRVVAAKAENFTTDSGETKRALLVQVDAYSALVEAHEAGQKLGWSIEVGTLPDTNEPFLFGLAATDSPSSFYTQLMEFNLLKKTDEAYKYGEYVENAFDFEPEKTETKPSFFSTFFSKNKPAEPEPIKPLEAQVGEFTLPKKFTDELQKFSMAFTSMEEKITQLEKQNNELIAKFSLLESTPADNSGHPFINNADNIVLADC